jgi:hypothetical protein
MPDVHAYALKGAMLSLAVMWRLQVIHARNPEGALRILRFLARRRARTSLGVLQRYDRKPKRLSSRKLYMLQGLPGVGPALANRLLLRFGSVEHVITADDWVDAALDMFGRVFGGATAYPKAKGIWRDDERGGALVKDEPVVIHCCTTPIDIQNPRKLAELSSFCRTMRRDARQGEIGLVIGDEYLAIRDFAEE